MKVFEDIISQMIITTLCVALGFGMAMVLLMRQAQQWFGNQEASKPEAENINHRDQQYYHDQYYSDSGDEYSNNYDNIDWMMGFDLILRIISLLQNISALAIFEK